MPDCEGPVKPTWVPQAESLFTTLKVWRRPLLTFCRTRVSNTRSETTNLTAKNIKRISRGYTDHAHYRTRILIYGGPESWLNTCCHARSERARHVLEVPGCLVVGWKGQQNDEHIENRSNFT